jgi:23S rRNA (uracil1939-C5)-methyltransferase
VRAMVIKVGVLDNLQFVNKGYNRLMTEFSTMLKCSYFPLCSGCEQQGDISSSPSWLHVKDFFHRIAPALPLSLTIKEVTGWRTRAKLAVRGNHQHPEIGLFKKGSHEVVSIPTCPLHHPSINKVCTRLREVMIEKKIPPYREEDATGLLRYLQFVVERKTKKVQLALVVNRSGKDSQLESFVQQLYMQAGLHSVWLNFQPAQTNRIFGDEWNLCVGDPYLWENLGGVDCAFHPACFGQAHLSIYEEALQKIKEWVDPHKHILELYAGVGTIGLCLSSQSQKVVSIEINPYASECFHLARLKLPLDTQRKISMTISSSQNAIPLIQDHEVMIVDPPRKGLEEKVLDAICHSSLSQLIYLSCGPLSFQRDCEKLLQHGWRIDKAECYLFFPGCDHVEILCGFKK